MKSNNYIANIGQADYAANGLYFTLTADYMNVTNNVIRDVNHTCFNFSSSTIKTEANITGNIFANWNRDGISGSGAGGSQGDGIYITKTNTSNTTPINIHQNQFTRDESLSGSKGYAARCSNNQGKIDLSANYWDTEYPLNVISGGTYSNVTISSVCDANMVVENQSIGKFSLSTSDLYASGKYKERKLSATLTMLDKTTDKPEVQFTTDTPEFITLETRDDGTYYVAKKAGEAKITAAVIDPVTKKEFTIETTFLVRDIELDNQVIEPNQTVQMTYKLVPLDEAFPTYYDIEWTSSDETIATVDENGLVTSNGKEGTAEIELTVKGFSTIYYQVTATVTVEVPVPNTAPIIHAEDKTLTVGEVFDPLKDVTATDKEDGDLTTEIEVIKNEVNVNEVGTYEVIYKVTDSEGASATKTITVTVKDVDKVDVTVTAILDGATEIIVSEEQYVKGYEIKNDDIEAYNAMLDDLKSTDTFIGYECKGFFLDKEGKKALELGHQFKEDTAIYMIWTSAAENPDDNPNVDKPNASNKADSVETRDNSNLGVYVSILGISGLSAAIFYTLKKKKELDNYNA